MNLFTMGNFDFTLINNYKIIIDNNTNNKNKIIKMVKSIINKDVLSEYAVTNNKINDLTINNTKINSKNFNIFYLDKNSFSIEEENKFGSKSLATQLLNKIIEENEVELQKINNDIKSINLKNDFLKFKINELDKKNLLKLTELIFEKDNLKINTNDLSYNETILFPLMMIKELSKDNNIIFLDIDFLTDEILSFVKETKNNIFIIFTNFITKNVEQQDLLLVKSNVIDFLDDDYFIETIDENITVEEFKKKKFDQLVEKYSF